MRSIEELEKQAQPLLAQYRELMAKDLPALNEMVNKAEYSGAVRAGGEVGR